MFKTKKGRYKPKNPKKYNGDPSNVIYRSSWEYRCMVYFDLNPNVLMWESEELIIPYKSPKDGRMHRYFPDFRIRVRTKAGLTQTILIEVKPFYQTQPPKIQSRRTKKYINEVMTYGVNTSKWHAAEEYCKDRQWKFQIITENELNIK
jgi:hypothetical protein|tara:strand:+ start:17659 stop:18102 length:444 start_codon:yes stop_codon:yes gene_type:complete